MYGRHVGTKNKYFRGTLSADKKIGMNRFPRFFLSLWHFHHFLSFAPIELRHKTTLTSPFPFWMCRYITRAMQTTQWKKKQAIVASGLPEFCLSLPLTMHVDAFIARFSGRKEEKKRKKKNLLLRRGMERMNRSWTMFRSFPLRWKTTETNSHWFFIIDDGFVMETMQPAKATHLTCP